MSGAPLFSGRHLIGVVTKDLSGWQHSRLTALPLERLPELPDFVGICSAYLGNPLRLATLRQTPDHSASFEDRYRAYVTETFGELSIFGLDFSRSEHAQWPLDSAYLSLELVHGEGGEGAPPSGVGPSRPCATGSVCCCGARPDPARPLSCSGWL